MGCRCGERASAIVDAAKAVANGDRDAFVKQTSFVLTSAIEDASAGFRQGVAAARLRLSRR